MARLYRGYRLEEPGVPKSRVAGKIRAAAVRANRRSDLLQTMANRPISEALEIYEGYRNRFKDTLPIYDLLLKLKKHGVLEKLLARK